MGEKEYLKLDSQRRVTLPKEFEGVVMISLENTGGNSYTLEIKVRKGE